jgi:hypothetical protein
LFSSDNPVSSLAGKSQELKRSGLKEVEIRADEIAGFVLIRIKRNFRQGQLCLSSDNHRDKRTESRVFRFSVQLTSDDCRDKGGIWEVLNGLNTSPPNLFLCLKERNLWVQSQLKLQIHQVFHFRSPSVP